MPSAQVTNLAVDDTVVPLDTGIGTWRQAAVVEASALHPVPRSLPVQAAATMVIKCVPLLVIVPAVARDGEHATSWYHTCCRAAVGAIYSYPVPVDAQRRAMCLAVRLDVRDSIAAGRGRTCTRGDLSTAQ